MDIKNQIQNQKTWDSIAKSFDKTRKRPWAQCISFINKIPRNSVIADIGAGNGRHLIPAAKQCKKAIAFDISLNLLKIIKEKIEKKQIKNIDLIQTNSVKLPIKNNSFDYILYIASLHNIKGKSNRIKSLEEIKRVLKKDGRALISVWSLDQEKFSKNNQNKNGDFQVYWRQDGLNIARFYHLYKKNEFKDDLIKSGFKIIDFKEEKIVSKKYPDNYFAEVK